MSLSVSLLEMPDVVMAIILRNADLRSILILRKVCRGLREFIDINKPETHLDFVRISVNTESIKLDMPFDSVKYQKNEGGCWISGRKSRRKLLKNLDFMSVFLDDFKIIMKNQKSAVGNFQVHFHLFKDHDFRNEELLETKFLEMWRQSVQQWRHLIPVKELIMSTVSKQEVMSVLPYLDSEFLESIDMFDARYVESFPIDIDSITQLKQWKNLKTLKMNHLIVSCPLEQFSHFSTVSIFRTSLTGEELTELKEVFSISTTLTSMELTYSSINKTEICDQLGQPCGTHDEMTRNRKTWETGLPHSTLQISLVRKEKNYVFRLQKFPQPEAVKCPADK
ncbi:hypothetical protein GCK72_019758 [Caenorhabditis remanei]|uniref:F-box domain-containing protein n=1 Tax=Caenorhabditis remanei TaxID=31234 RepID=A0A6A5GFE2_CAERE|nr:hypothetical protein GCK72_019758 [Caenorhabditis remanei]KAF1753202.1 hypothetical protein GCK72_019758 [Caenorhabditis remanei]